MQWIKPTQEILFLYCIERCPFNSHLQDDSFSVAINTLAKSTQVYICYLPGGRSVWEKNCARGLEYGPRPRAVLKTKGTVFSYTDRPSPVHNIFFSCNKLVLQPLTNGFVYATLSLNRVARRLLTICKKSLQRTS